MPIAAAVVIAILVATGCLMSLLKSRNGTSFEKPSFVVPTYWPRFQTTTTASLVAVCLTFFVVVLTWTTYVLLYGTRTGTNVFKNQQNQQPPQEQLQHKQTLSNSNAMKKEKKKKSNALKKQWYGLYVDNPETKHEEQLLVVGHDFTFLAKELSDMKPFVPERYVQSAIESPGHLIFDKRNRTTKITVWPSEAPSTVLASSVSTHHVPQSQSVCNDFGYTLYTVSQKPTSIGHGKTALELTMVLSHLRQSVKATQIEDAIQRDDCRVHDVNNDDTINVRVRPLYGPPSDCKQKVCSYTIDAPMKSYKDGGKAERYYREVTATRCTSEENEGC